MALQVDEQWLNAYLARTGQVKKMGGTGNVTNSYSSTPTASGEPGTGGRPQITEKRPKYGNQKVESQGKKFDSKHEAKVYEELRLRCLAGEFVGMGTQFVFYLPGGVKYVADFVMIRPDHSLEVIDAKSEATKKNSVYRLKKRLMKECLKFLIQEL